MCRIATAPTISCAMSAEAACWRPTVMPRFQMRTQGRGLRTEDRTSGHAPAASRPGARKSLAADDPEATRDPCSLGPVELAGYLKPIPPAWCWTIVRRWRFSMAIRRTTASSPACEWPRLCMMSASRSDGIWTRKGVRREATSRLAGCIDRGPERSRGRAGDNPRIREGHQGGSCDPRTWRGRLRGSPGGSLEEVDEIEFQVNWAYPGFASIMATVMISFLAGLFNGRRDQS